MHVDEDWTPQVRSRNPLGFPGYTPPDPEEESGRAGLVHGPEGDYVLVAYDFHRSGGTMGVVAGELVVEAYRRATEHRLPVALSVSSGGARLQEGFFALVQMGRTASAAAAHRAAGLRSAAAYLSPTNGGAFASFGNAVDLRAVEPGAVIGFGGPRVVEAVTGELPLPGSHTAESALRDGNVDAVIEGAAQQRWLEQAIGVRALDPLPRRPRRIAAPRPRPREDEWAVLEGVRRPEHETSGDWLARLVDGWMPFRGTGPAGQAGIARIEGREAVVVALGRNRLFRLESLPTPADFRLAQRALAFADRVGLPVLTLIDTPGVNPSTRSEADGLAREVSATVLAMAQLRTPSVALCVGEGGSGGAMALAHADTLLMLEDTAFPVIGPEPGAAVLYRDVARAPELARDMRISARDLAEYGLVDALLPYRASAVREAVLAGFDPARIGDRLRRPDRATRAAMETAAPVG